MKQHTENVFNQLSTDLEILLKQKEIMEGKMREELKSLQDQISLLGTLKKVVLVLSGCKWTQTHNHLVCKQKLSYLDKLA